MSEYYRFDIPLCERNALLTAEDLQQYRDPLMRGALGFSGESVPPMGKS